MAKQNSTNTVDTLPTLDDFTESSLLDVMYDNDEEEDIDGDDPDNSSDDADSSDDLKNPPKNPLSKKFPEKKKAEEDQDQKDEEEEEEEEIKKTPKAKKVDTDADSDDDDADADEPETQDTFWSDVEKLTGIPVKVDYGNIDPESPEGAAKREAALVDQVEDGIWKYIENTFPKSFKALQLESNGGDLSQLITPDYVDYSKITLDPENTSQQKKILMDYYMEVKKLPENKATRMVEADEDSEEDQGLFNAAKEALEERKLAQKEREETLIANTQKEANKRKQEDQQMLSYIKAITDKGEVGNFKLNSAEKDDFYNFFASQVNRNPEGGYIFSAPLTNDNFNKVLEQAYFSFKGGKLDQLVDRRAVTNSTRKLKRAIKQENTKGSSSSSDSDRENKGLPTMKNFEANE